jgi:transketolase
MRTAFIDTITKLAEKDDRVWLLTGDLGFSVFEGFRDRFPERFLNVGVAEQDLMGVAAGLALVGKRPFVYSITTFASMRAYEQVRLDICYQNLSVVIIGGGSTFSYSTFGATHMPMEDMAIMRVLPNMRILSPGDPREVGVLLRAAYEAGGPTYMRIAKKGEPIVHQNVDRITPNAPITLREGTDVALLVTGRQLPNALAAAEELEKKRISTRVIDVHTIKPLNEDAIRDSVKGVRACVVVEEHSVIGGLGDAVARLLLEGRILLPFKSLGITDQFPKGVYSQESFLDRYSLSIDGIVGTIIELLNSHGE